MESTGCSDVSGGKVPIEVTRACDRESSEGRGGTDTKVTTEVLTANHFKLGKSSGGSGTDEDLLGSG